MSKKEYEGIYIVRGFYKQIKPFYTSKGVRLDVYLKDDNKIIDVEIQTYRQDAIGKRTRYYQSMIDIDSLMKGQDYTELLDSYVLFICTYDPFLKDKRNGYGLPCYTFKNTCLENGDVSLVTLAKPKTTCQQRQVVVIFKKERHFAVLRLASIDWKSLRTKPAYSGANTWRAIFLFAYLFSVYGEGAE